MNQDERRAFHKTLDVPVYETTVIFTPRVALNIMRQMETEDVLDLIDTWITGVWGDKQVEARLQLWANEIEKMGQKE